MAISAPHYHCLKELHRCGELPQGGSLLEIGEANWYGDIDPESVGLNRSDDLFAIAKQVYLQLFAARTLAAIDANGTPAAHRMDLNQPIDLGWQFETVINHGTLEHVFNAAQVLQTMHNHCAVGGLMIHESPFTGWIDHGFYTIQPTLYFDLAAANKYEILHLAVTSLDHPLPVVVDSREQLLEMARLGTLPSNAMLFVALSKTTDGPFKIPMQGYYAQTISSEAAEAWEVLR